MGDTERCPSCDVEPNELKFDVRIVGETAGLRYRHAAGCTIGRAEPVGRTPHYGIWPIGDSPVSASGRHYRCSRCAAEFTLTSETPIRYIDGGGFASLDCPLCWARAEALGRDTVERWMAGEEVSK